MNKDIQTTDLHRCYTDWFVVWFGFYSPYCQDFVSLFDFSIFFIFLTDVKAPLNERELTVLYMADLVIDDKIIVELKSVSALNKVMEAQLLNYLKLSHLQVGYLMNFNSLRLEWRRFVNQK